MVAERVPSSSPGIAALSVAYTPGKGGFGSVGNSTDLPKEEEDDDVLETRQFDMGRA
jgi:hypothetical protein